MTDEQKRKKPGREIGGIQEQRWNHFGSEDEESELSDAPDTQLSKKPDSQISSILERQMVDYPESQLASNLASQIAESQDKQIVSYVKEKKPERKAQIAYLPPGVIKRLKRFAFDHNLEISMVVQVAITEFLERRENEELLTD